MALASLRRSLSALPRFPGAAVPRLHASPFTAEAVDRFRAEEKRRESQWRTETLRAEEVAIHEAHAEAIENLKETYDDPLTGFKVFTRWKHFLAGKCCGNGCRHVRCRLPPRRVTRRDAMNVVSSVLSASTTWSRWRTRS